MSRLHRVVSSACSAFLHCLDWMTAVSSPCCRQTSSLRERSGVAWEFPSHEAYLARVAPPLLFGGRPMDVTVGLELFFAEDSLTNRPEMALRPLPLLALLDDSAE